MLQIGVFIDMTRGRDRDLLNGIAAYARQRPDWNILLGPEASEVKWRHTLLHEFDGLILRVRDSSLDKLLHDQGKRAINVSSALPHSRLPVVAGDEQAIGRVAAEFLLGQGYDHLAFCGDVSREYVKKRRDGLLRVLQTRRRRLASEVNPYADPDLATWLARLPRPVAVFAATDRSALMLAEICRTRQIRVPDEVALLGVNNDQLMCELAPPGLSSIDLSADKMGRDAASLLDDWLRTGESPMRIPSRPIPRVIARGSTGIATHLDERVAKAIAFIRMRISSGVAVEDVLEHVDASRTTIEVGLKTAVGRTIHQEIQHQRLLHAQNLLLHSDLSMGEVAARSGYSTQQRFSMTFRAATGKTPTAFRHRTPPPATSLI